MKPTLRHIYAAIFAALVACVVLPGVVAAQPAASAEQSYRASAQKRTALIERLEQLEGRYKSIVGKIEARKRAGAMETFAGRLELGNLLRESKSLADELARLQESVRMLDGTLEQKRTNVLSKIDAEVVRLERKLATSSRSERRALVRQLNEMRRQRAGYSAPLPDAPSIAEIRDALSLAEEVDPSQPEELLAAADELQDTEDQIRRRLDALRERLDTLNQRKRLMRRADNFLREERFFEETDRNRVIARVEKGEGTTNSGQEPDNSTNNSTVDSSGQVDSNNAAPPQSDDLATGGAAEFDGAADPASAPNERAPGMTDAPGTPEEAPAQSPSSSDSPFQGSSETVVIAAGAEPTRSVSAEATRVRDVDAAIDDLENEERELTKQADALKKRAGDLRSKAQQVR